MKSIWLVLFLVLGLDKFTQTADINEKQKQAASAYRNNDFQSAVKNYEFLVYETENKDPKVLLNLAHSYRRNNQADKAKKAYLNCVKSPDAILRSIAWEQLGTLETKIQNYQQALTYYKRALVANPKNEQARYNYELLKKYLKQHPEQKNQIPPPQKQENKKEDQKKPEEDKNEKQPQNQEKPSDNGQEKETEKPEAGNEKQKQDQENKPGQNQPEKQNQIGENSTGNGKKSGEETGDEEGIGSEEENKQEPKKPQNNGENQQISGNEQNMKTQYERLRQMNISPEKAEMMLDAMKNAEQQYLQQLPKKATKKADRSKPDW